MNWTSNNLCTNTHRLYAETNTVTWTHHHQLDLPQPLMALTNTLTFMTLDGYVAVCSKCKGLHVCVSVWHSQWKETALGWKLEGELGLDDGGSVRDQRHLNAWLARDCFRIRLFLDFCAVWVSVSLREHFWIVSQLFFLHCWVVVMRLFNCGGPDIRTVGPGSWPSSTNCFPTLFWAQKESFADNIPCYLFTSHERRYQIKYLLNPCWFGMLNWGSWQRWMVLVLRPTPKWLSSRESLFVPSLARQPSWKVKRKRDAEECKQCLFQRMAKHKQFSKREKGLNWASNVQQNFKQRAWVWSFICWHACRQVQIISFWRVVQRRSKQKMFCRVVQLEILFCGRIPWKYPVEGLWSRNHIHGHLPQNPAHIKMTPQIDQNTVCVLQSSFPVTTEAVMIRPRTRQFPPINSHPICQGRAVRLGLPKDARSDAF